MNTAQQIVIVGGGMTGGLLALLLAEQDNLEITVLDGAPAPSLPQGEPQLRVSTLTEASYWLLRNSGAWDQLDPQRLQPYAAMQVWDHDGSGELTFHASDAGASNLGWLVENGHLSAALYQAAASKDNLHWLCNVQVDQARRQQHGWQISAADQHWQADLLIGADGANSRIRSWAGLAGSPRDSGHHALVATIATEQPHAGCARQAFLESGPLALLPLFGDGRQCSIVWSGWPDTISELREMDEARFNQALSVASGEALGQCRVLSQRAVFPIQERHASSYVAPALALVGDAAHVIHPLAGQGVNLGLMDAAVLAEEVARALSKGRPCADASALARYERRRRGENLLMQNAMRGFKALFERRELPIRWLRNSGLSAVNKAAPLRSFFVRQALGRGGDPANLAKGPAARQ